MESESTTLIHLRCIKEFVNLIMNNIEQKFDLKSNRKEEIKAEIIYSLISFLSSYSKINIFAVCCNQEYVYFNETEEAKNLPKINEYGKLVSVDSHKIGDLFRYKNWIYHLTNFPSSLCVDGVNKNPEQGQPMMISNIGINEVEWI